MPVATLHGLEVETAVVNAGVQLRVFTLLETQTDRCFIDINNSLLQHNYELLVQAKSTK